MRAEELVGLETVDGDPRHTTYELAPHLTRHDGALFGGAALGASLEAFEVATGRRALWGTTQFIASSPFGVRIDQTVEVLAEGRNVCQLRLEARTDGRLLYTALGAAVHDRGGAVGALEGSAAEMPKVAGPEDGIARDDAELAQQDFGFQLVAEHRIVDFPSDPTTGEPPPGRLAIWARLRGATQHTPASLAFLADFIPLGITHSTGAIGAGTSLDNTLRLGHLVDTEWVLLDIEGSLARDGYGHGHAHVWAEDGTLLATASQSSPLLIFEG